ncbi:hypothetical protein LCGC14_2415780 [marine sediment metagenome]|uniref:HNH nuclease domain-containing protein n=1 Tax=marine sediment metagenome TaxID=412755 RepID=A0A0F9E3B0_9ZZZZ
MKMIKLSSGEEVRVDDKDYDNLNAFKWHLHRSGNFKHLGKPYAARSQARKGEHPVTIRMHRQIMNCPKGMDVDHLDDDVLNNQRHNLERTTHKENMRRTHKKKCMRISNVC